MDINKRNRTELKEFFNEGDIPTEKQFAELIDANINQMEDGIAKVPGNPLAIMAEGENAGTQEVLQFYTDFKQDNPNWSVNMHPRVNPDNPETATPGLNIKDAAGNSRMFIQSNKGNVGFGTLEPDSKLTIKGDNDTSLVSVIDTTQQRSKIFEVRQQEGNGLISVRNGKADESVHIEVNKITFEDAKDAANIKSAKIASEEDTFRIYGKSSNPAGTNRAVEIVADQMNITGNVLMNNLSSNPTLQEGGEASDRTIASQRAVKTYVDTRLPKGLISMWSGNEIPSGWALCDGTNGAPDLRGRFVVGLDKDKADYNTIGNKGGDEKVALTKAQLPAHKHSGTTNESGNHRHTFVGAAKRGDGGGTGSSNDYYKAFNRITAFGGVHTHSFATNETGGNQPHENRPPYFVLAYIMKV
ncbi:phage baseplate protein [Aquimarina rubra]|uniref:Baseplate structural protein Gp10 C-terminal domain-containing protein n=1 Tax=Aquimarina rubra TaxID=1920033 RepID=A0ABW5LEC6_9FLAO